MKAQELGAYDLTKLYLGDYYLTYPGLTVEDEVKSVLVDESDFHEGPAPLGRDSPDDLSPGFYVRDGQYLSARWPGDAYSFAYQYVDMINA